MLFSSVLANSQLSSLRFTFNLNTLELCPLGRKFMSNREQPQRTDCLRRFNGSIKIFHSLPAQKRSTFPHSVAEMKDDTTYRFVIKLARFVFAGVGWQFQLPFADHT